jgi:hypothetical protein
MHWARFRSCKAVHSRDEATCFIFVGSCLRVTSLHPPSSPITAIPQGPAVESISAGHCSGHYAGIITDKHRWICLETGRYTCEQRSATKHRLLRARCSVLQWRVIRRKLTCLAFRWLKMEAIFSFETSDCHRLCGLVVSIPGCRTEMYCASLDCKYCYK